MNKNGNGFDRWLAKKSCHLRRTTRDPLVLEMGGRATICFLSDLHVGSERCNKNEIYRFCKDAINKGAKHFFVNGDYIEGKPGGIVLSTRLLKEVVNEQIDELKKCLPADEGVKYYFLNGNHESKVDGLLGRGCLKEMLLEDREDDFRYIGEGIRRIDARGIYIDLLHPQGMNNGCVEKYVRMYLAQVWNYGPPAIVDVGHFHERKQWDHKGVTCLTNGAFLKKNGNGYGKAGWVMEIRSKSKKADVPIYDSLRYVR